MILIFLLFQDQKYFYIIIYDNFLIRYANYFNHYNMNFDSLLINNIDHLNLKIQKIIILFIIFFIFLYYKILNFLFI
jgi:hypothetical protein